MIDFSKKVTSVKTRLEEIEKELSNPDVFSDSKRYAEITREHTRLNELIKAYDRITTIEHEIQENKKLLESEDDSDIIDMVKADLESLEEELPKKEKALKTLIIPENSNDSKNCIVEIRPAAGGDEAALFADNLYNMYVLYAESQGWKTNVLECTPSDLGGIKSISFQMIGGNVYKQMFFESGVHRVQRVPETESQGRIHTSTVTVAVLPEAEEVDLNINPNDLRFDTFRSSGAGGQCVNTTDSAVRVTHIPTGIFVASQQERSQHKNKEIAIRILRSRLLEDQIEKERKKQAAERKGQVGTGDRSERIRTYNYPQNRVSDHRYNLTFYDLSNIMAGGLGILTEEILALEAEAILKHELEN